MIDILYVGKYNEKGRFSTAQWGYYIEWCKIGCNRIIIYSHMPYSIICDKFSSYCIIRELEKPDEALDIYAYEIDVINVVFWNYIKEYNYDIDVKDDISHIYFFSGKKYIASLEVVDYENYVLIEEPIYQKNLFIIHKDMILDNIQFCDERKEDIKELVAGENWRPLGYEER